MNRTQLIKVIHVARRELRLDDDTYRQLLKTHSGIDSLRDMTDSQLKAIFDVMKKRGFKVKSKEPALYDKQAAMIHALWRDMAENGVVRDGREQALNTFIKRQTGIDRMEWLSTKQASQVIECLKKWLSRGGQG